MPREVTPATPHARSSSFLSLLSGWVQQGVESFFATQRILVDLALRQNASAMKSLREGLSDPKHSPVAIMTELGIEGMSSFVEAQRILLTLAEEENELVMSAVKERVDGSTTAVAMTDLVRRSIGTFLEMEQDFLKNTSKQTIKWLEAAKTGKGYDGSHLVDGAREAMENFVHAQKKFLDIVAQETAKITEGRAERAKPAKKTELSKLARDASNAFIEAQKKLLDVAGQQMNVNLEMASRTMELLTPFRLLPMANITGEGVKNFVNAEKAVIDSMMKPHPGKATVAPPSRAKRPARRRKAAAAQAAAA